MKPIFKKILLAVLVLVVIAVSYGLYQWYKPHRNVQNEEAVIVTAPALYKAFQANEKDPRYLDKAIQVSGVITETKTNQAGKTVCILQTDDLIFGINCTFTKNTTLQPQQQVTIKGLCTGYLSGADVVLIDCDLVK
jgi:hypothetical protein